MPRRPPRPRPRLLAAGALVGVTAALVPFTSAAARPLQRAAGPDLSILTTDNLLRATWVATGQATTTFGPPWEVCNHADPLTSLLKGMPPWGFIAYAPPGTGDRRLNPYEMEGAQVGIDYTFTGLPAGQQYGIYLQYGGSKARGVMNGTLGSNQFVPKECEYWDDTTHQQPADPPVATNWYLAGAGSAQGPQHGQFSPDQPTTDKPRFGQSTKLASVTADTAGDVSLTLSSILKPWLVARLPSSRYVNPEIPQHMVAPFRAYLVPEPAPPSAVEAETAATTRSDITHGSVWDNSGNCGPPSGTAMAPYGHTFEADIPPIPGASGNHVTATWRLNLTPGSTYHLEADYPWVKRAAPLGLNFDDCAVDAGGQADIKVAVTGRRPFTVNLDQCTTQFNCPSSPTTVDLDSAVAPSDGVVTVSWDATVLSNPTWAETQVCWFFCAPWSEPWSRPGSYQVPNGITALPASAGTTAATGSRGTPANASLIAGSRSGSPLSGLGGLSLSGATLGSGPKRETGIHRAPLLRSPSLGQKTPNDNGYVWDTPTPPPVRRPPPPPPRPAPVVVRPGRQRMY